MKKKKWRLCRPPQLSDDEAHQIFKEGKEARKRREAREKESGSGDCPKRWPSWEFRFLPPSLRRACELAARTHTMPPIRPIGYGNGVSLGDESPEHYQRRCERWLVRLGKKKPPRFTPPPPPKIKPLPHTDNSARNGKWKTPGDINPQDFPPSQG